MADFRSSREITRKEKWKFMRLFCSIIFMLVLSANSYADSPILFRQVDLGQPISEVHAAEDNKTVVAVVQSTDSRKAGIRLIDISDPSAPILQGFLAQDGDHFAIAPDGKHGLLLRDIEKEAYNTATRREIVAIDLSDPKTPKEQWRRGFSARRVTVADDASAYAASQTIAGQEGKWQTSIFWVDDRRRPFVIDDDQYSNPQMQFSEKASFLVSLSFDQSLEIADLRGKDVALYKQRDSSVSRYRCVPAILESGYVLAEDERTSRFAIYAPTIDVPRVSTIPHESKEYCKTLTSSNAEGLAFANEAGHVERLDLSHPKSPAITGSWQMEPSTIPLAVSRALLYAVNSAAPTNLKIYRLDQMVSEQINWTALETAYRLAMDGYAKDTKARNPIPFYEAIRRLEAVGVLSALNAKIGDVSPKVAAAIFNDYGFLVAKSGANFDVSETALRRSIALDPDRAVAYLNLADILRNNLGALTDFDIKEKRSLEIEELYKKYISLGGKETPHIGAMLNGKASSESNVDACTAIANFANAGRLQELVSDKATNIRVGENSYDVLFKTEGTAHVPGMYLFDANTDWLIEPADIHVSVPDDENLWGGDELGLVSYRNSYYILHYRDFNHPIAMSSFSGGKECHFKTEVKEEIGVRVVEPNLCQKLISGKAPDAINFDVDTTILPATVQQTYGETASDGMKIFDFANDGKSKNVVALDLSSGAGAGCEEAFFDILDKTGKKFDKGESHDQIMALQNANPSNRYPILPCGNEAKFFVYNQKTYFENKPATWPPIDKWNEYHRVARIDNGKALDVCDFKFRTNTFLSN